MPDYGDPNYWDDRYEKSGKDNTFDWLESYQSLSGVLEQFLGEKDSRILILGCGNAEFSEDLYDAGYENVVNIDISSVCIEQMNERNKEKRPKMVFQVGDVTHMPEFKDNSFDMAIDKSTIDALLCGDDSFIMVAKMLKETQRVLKTDGIYFAISYGKPESRAFHFNNPFLSWTQREFVLFDADCETEEEKESKSHYIYVCKKKADADTVSKENFEDCIKILQEEQVAAALAADDSEGEVEEKKDDDDEEGLAVKANGESEEQIKRGNSGNGEEIDSDKEKSGKSLSAADSESKGPASKEASDGRQEVV